MLRLPPPPPENRPVLSEPEGDHWGPPPVPALPADLSAAQQGPVRMRTDLPPQPRPNPHGRNLPSPRFGQREVDPVPAGSFLTPEPALDDSPVSDDELP